MDLLSYKLGQKAGGGGGEINNQQKTVTPKTTAQNVTPDSGYTGLSKVIVEATPLETKSVTPTTLSQTITPTSPNIGLSSVTVNAIETETKSVTPSTSSQTITPTTGKFIDEINVSAVTSSIDQNITASNIKKDVSILGVAGTYEGESTGAYKVSSVEEMNAITGMQQDDVCVVVTEGSASLPSGYTEVEYLQSSGTQYIDTNYAPYKTKTEIKFALTDTSQMGQLAGVYGPNDDRYYVLDVNDTTNGKMSIVDRKFNTIYNTNANTSIHTIIYNDENNKVWFDNYIVGTVSNLPSRRNVNMDLFARRGSSQAERIIYAKIYYAKIWDNGVLVRDMIPCYRNSDNVAGMYDTINNVFYTNAGTGAFTVGSVTGKTYNTYVYDTTNGWEAV